MSIAGIALVCTLPGCEPTTECGSWAFSGTPGERSFSVSAAFTFTPATCGKNCDCQTDCIIQMVWVYNQEDRTYMYASGQPGASARATANGWTIDQLGGWAYAYYGLNNDKTFDNSYNPPGSNNNPTTLFDTPSGWPNNTLFYALDATVCYKSKTCQNRILGYYFWSWSIDNDGKSAQFIVDPAWKDLDAQFQEAVTGWNNWAPTSGPQNQGGGQPVLPNAVPLPTLTDL
jgi:hypothetical protein